MIGARTRVFALLGDPVAHSLSPAMHNAAFRALGLDAVYVALRCGGAAVGSLMDALASAGGGGNVTVPHKRAAAAHLAGTGLATVNTFWGDGGRTRGTDTDSGGIEAVWRRLGGPEGDWCVLGTGGSARAAAIAAMAAGAAVAVRSRSRRRAADFAAWVHEAGGRAGSLAGAAVVVNCTPLGLSDADPLPIEPAAMPEGALAVDLVYAEGGTQWSRAARVSGRRAVDGREVLLAQGAEAFRCWFPGSEPPIEVMRAAVASALGTAAR
jgi:shikimate dehydrogenase